jgi:alkylhydroperoxidase/carboxymuconolactone decarboxylase family protein YurZ/quinol monooxygenase YgiN
VNPIINNKPAAWLAGIVACVLSMIAAAEAQTMKTESLNSKQQNIVTIAAFTASGDLPKLGEALNAGLDAGLTINEIKEVLVQLYAYAGFPRSLNGIGTFMSVLEARKKKGVEDSPGKEASPRAANKSSVELGTENQTTLIGAPATGAYITFAPAIDQFLKGHLFGDIFGRDNLDFQTREVATIAALSNMEGVNSQLQAHFRLGFNTGLTEAQMRSLIEVLAAKVGWPQADNAGEVLDKVLNRETTPPARKIVRLAKLQIHAVQLETYKAALKEEIETSLQAESGVLVLQAVAEKDNPTQITILEVYANAEAYQAHLETPHFKEYKTSTSGMVESLELVEVEPVVFGGKMK